MPRKRLTEEGVAKLKPLPGKKQLLLFDTVMPGLLLNVSYAGTKTWRVLHYINGKPVTAKLKRYPVLKLKEAREAAREFLKDPNEARRRAKSDTFEAVAQKFLELHVYELGLRTAPEIERKLRKYILPRWGKTRFLDIRRGDVVDLMDAVVKENGPVQADAVLALVSKICSWHQSRVENYTSPIVAGMRRTKTDDRARTRVLNDDEIRVVWREASELDIFGGLVKFLLLTCQRREKASTVKQSDIVRGVWEIASDNREKTNAGALRLPRAAMDIVDAMPLYNSNPYVFPAETGPGPINSFSQRKAELDALVRKRMPNIENWTLHDLRRTGRSLMSRLRVPTEHAELVLGHSQPSIQRTYDQYEYFDEKSEALEKLAGLIEEIVKPVARPQRPITGRTARASSERRTVA